MRISSLQYAKVSESWSIEGLERRRDAAPVDHIPDLFANPLPQGFLRCEFVAQLVCPTTELLDIGPVDRLQESFSTGEMAIEQVMPQCMPP